MNEHQTAAALDRVLDLAETLLAERPTGHLDGAHEIAMIGRDFGLDKTSIALVRSTHDNTIDVLMLGTDRPGHRFSLNPGDDPDLRDINDAIELLETGAIALPHLVPYGLVDNGAVTAIVTCELRGNIIGYTVMLAEDAWFPTELAQDTHRPNAFADVCRHLWSRVADGSAVQLADRLLAAGPVIQTIGETQAVATVAQPGGFPSLAERYIAWDVIENRPMTLPSTVLETRATGHTEDLTAWWQRPFSHR